MTSPTGSQNLDLELVTEDSLPKRPISSHSCADDWFSCGIILNPTFLMSVVLIYIHGLVTKLCLPLDPMNCSPPGYSLHGIFQAKILEWVVMSSSRRSSQPRNWIHVSYISCIGRLILYHWANWEASHFPICQVLTYSQVLTSYQGHLELVWIYC